MQNITGVSWVHCSESCSAKFTLKIATEIYYTIIFKNDDWNSQNLKSQLGDTKHFFLFKLINKQIIYQTLFTSAHHHYLSIWFQLEGSKLNIIICRFACKADYYFLLIEVEILEKCQYIPWELEIRSL